MNPKVLSMTLLTATLIHPDGIAQMITYPTTQKVDHVDTYHGTQVPDPYRWLEDDRSAETAAWVKAENEVTFGYLNQIPFRKKIFDDLEKAYNYPKYSAPRKKGEYFYFYKNDGLQNQSVLYHSRQVNIFITWHGVAFNSFLFFFLCSFFAYLAQSENSLANHFLTSSTFLTTALSSAPNFFLAPWPPCTR